jgi:hypothetical protein
MEVMEAKFEEMRWNDMPFEWLDSSARLLQKYFAAILEVERGGLTDFEPQLLGSGTFVRVDDIYGILTAEHVSNCVEQVNKIGIIVEDIPERKHRFTIDKQHLEIENIFIASGTPEGPDLAFIRILPTEKLGTLKATKSFYDLGVGREEILDRPKELDIGAWCLCGVPDEFTVRETIDRGPDYLKGYSGLCYYCQGVREELRSEYDLLTIAIDYNENTGNKAIPQSFGGCSGGGLWQIPLVKENVVTSKKPILSGVAFWQTAVDGKKREIICHGRRSIYKSAYEVIKRSFS